MTGISPLAGDVFGDSAGGVRVAAPKLVGHLFPRLLGQSEYNERLKAAAPLMEVALRWIAEATPGSAELLRLTDGTPVPCGQPVVTVERPDLAPDSWCVTAEPR